MSTALDDFPSSLASKTLHTGHCDYHGDYSTSKCSTLGPQYTHTYYGHRYTIHTHTGSFVVGCARFGGGLGGAEIKLIGRPVEGATSYACNLYVRIPYYRVATGDIAIINQYNIIYNMPNI